MATASVFLRATRAKTTPIILAPVMIGSALAWRAGAPFAFGALTLTLVGAAALHLGSNAFNDVYDERSGADKMARIDRSGIYTGSGVLHQGLMSERAVLALGVVLFAVALACGVALALSRGWEVLIFGGLGALLGHQYSAKPLRYGYHLGGMAGVVLAYGVFPVTGSHFVQAASMTSDAAWASVVPGLLTGLVFFHHDFLHWRADKAAKKFTLVNRLEPQIASAVSGFGLILVYVTLTVQVAIGLFPTWSLLALITMVPVGGSWSRMARDPVLPQNALNLLGTTLGASVLTAVVLTVSLTAARA